MLQPVTKKRRAPMTPGKGRSRMWQSMRILRRFTSADLQAAAETSAENCSDYLHGLLDAGYLRIVKSFRRGYVGGHAVYQLIKDTGPYAPRLGKQALRDPNIEPTEREATVTIPRSEYERALACAKACAGMTDPVAEVQALREGTRP